MTRIFAAAATGAVVLFAWGAFSWMVLPWHNHTLHPLVNESDVVQSLKNQLSHSGVYYFPAMPESDSSQAWESYHQRHREGPIGLMFYHGHGREPMSAGTFATGFVINFATALSVAWIVCLTSHHANTFIKRLGVAGLIGLLTVTTADLAPWNWMHMNTGYSLVNAADHFLGTLLMGLPIAAMIKPKG